MNLRPQRQDAPDINLTPLIDVVFLLLIFFMVSTTFKDDGRLRLELPRADGEPAAAEEITLIEVIIDRFGRYYVNDAQVVDTDLATVEKALIGAAGERRDLPVLIKADARTPHQAVMRVLDAASQLGLVKIAFATSQPDEGAPDRKRADPGDAAPAPNPPADSVGR